MEKLSCHQLSQLLTRSQVTAVTVSLGSGVKGWMKIPYMFSDVKLNQQHCNRRAQTHIPFLKAPDEMTFEEWERSL